MYKFRRFSLNLVSLKFDYLKKNVDDFGLTWKPFSTLSSLEIPLLNNIEHPISLSSYSWMLLCYVYLDRIWFDPTYYYVGIIEVDMLVQLIHSILPIM